MGVIGCCCKFSAVLVALFAILLGTLISGHLKQTGIFRWQDQYQSSRGQIYKGLFPVHHEGTPWGFTLEEMPDLSGETVLVTGANVGLGYWTAYHLASKKATVIIGCRSQSKCDDAAKKIKAETGTAVETALLDLSSFDSIRAGAKAIAAKHATLDSLNLNAGVMMPPFGLTKDGLEMQIGTNHFGHFLLTDLLLPQLEAAAKAKGVATVVSVSSAAHYDSYPDGILPSTEHMNDEKAYQRDKAYGQSKLANVLFAQELAERVKAKNILVNSVHPGGVDTELFRHMAEVISTYISPAAAEFFQATIAGFAWKPRDAALTQLYASVGPTLRQKKVTGKYFHPIAREAKPDLHAANITLQKHLWTLTEDFINAHP